MIESQFHWVSPGYSEGTCSWLCQRLPNQYRASTRCHTCLRIVFQDTLSSNIQGYAMKSATERPSMTQRQRDRVYTMLGQDFYQWFLRCRHNSQSWVDHKEIHPRPDRGPRILPPHRMSGIDHFRAPDYIPSLEQFGHVALVDSRRVEQYQPWPEQGNGGVDMRAVIDTHQRMNPVFRAQDTFQPFIAHHIACTGHQIEDVPARAQNIGGVKQRLDIPYLDLPCGLSS